MSVPWLGNLNFGGPYPVFVPGVGTVVYDTALDTYSTGGSGGHGGVFHTEASGCTLTIDGTSTTFSLVGGSSFSYRIAFNLPALGVGTHTIVFTDPHQFTAPNDDFISKTIVVDPTPPPALDPLVLGPPTLPDGVINALYNQTFTASGGDGHYQFAVISGFIPPEFFLNYATGVLSGTPTIESSTYTFRVQLSDESGTTPISIEYTINIPAVGAIHGSTIVDGRSTFSKRITLPKIFLDPVAVNAKGPLPSRVPILATIEQGIGYTITGYGWQKVAGDDADDVIQNPSALSTAVMFGAYVPGIYTYSFTVVGVFSESELNAPSVTNKLTITIPHAVPPVVSSDSQVLTTG